MNYVFAFILCLLILPGPTLERKPGESPEAFVLRQFEGELQKEIIELHPIIVTYMTPLFIVKEKGGKNTSPISRR